jgi:hypothetical protein
MFYSFERLLAVDSWAFVLNHTNPQASDQLAELRQKSSCYLSAQSSQTAVVT